MTVTLRQRKMRSKISLYLDYYRNGKRKAEYLNLYLHLPSPRGKLSSKHSKQNAETMLLAEKIRAKRFLEIQNGIYGFNDAEKLKGSFIKYIEILAKQKYSSKGNYDNWDSMLKHLRKFSPMDVTFGEINKEWIERFKEYLKKAKTPSGKMLSENTRYSYFNKLRAAIKQAEKDDILHKNPCRQVEGFKQGEPQREFLSYEELKALSNAECDSIILKNAFLFSCLTGLRWSDVNKLVWSEIFHSEEMGYYIRFRQKKTGGAETLPISDQAFALLGERGPATERIFVGLKYSAYMNLKIQQWVMRAGITKTISFHCARHTYATLQLSLGTDIFTVSKLLGHRELKTTQIYAKVIDKNKIEAANKIIL